ncbi:MAG: PorV/PorQ family protein [FCB group bacterium]|nr:PorV/PorQ family protein [FCB group bacterium]
MKYYKPFIAFCIALGLVGAQKVNKTGTTAAGFLKIGAGARAVGLGGAFVSLADDASAMYWNPSGITQLKSGELLVNRSQWIADIAFTYLGFVQPLPGIGTVGLQVTAMTMGEMEVTRYGYEEGTGETFRAGSYALGLTYARSLTDRFSIGGTVKYINEYISQSSASGLAIDLGTLFLTPFKDIRFGVSISNFGQKLQISGKDLLVNKDIDPLHNGNNESVNAYLATDRFDLPLLLRVGLSGELLNSPALRLTWAVDGIHPNDNSEYVNTGLELALLNNLVMLRGGLKSLYQQDGEEQFTLGAGLKVPVNRSMLMEADYAFESFIHLNNIHKLAIRIVF